MTSNNDIEKILTLATKAGTTYAEVYQARSQSRPVLFEGNRLKQLESSQAIGTALRLWKDGCPGLAVAYGKIDPEALVNKATSIAQLNSSETIELTEARIDICPPIGKFISPEKLIEIGKFAIASIRDVYPEVFCSAEFECEEETITLVNSLGLHCEYTDISLSYYLGVELVRGEDFLGIYDGEETRGNINCDRIIQQILQRLDWAKTNVTSPTGKIPVLLTANAATILWSTVSAALSGKRVLEGSSPWSESQGNLVMSPLVSLSQQPDKEPHNCPFDDEGIPTKSLALITQGKLDRFYSDRAVGREVGSGTTGNGFRPDLGSYPTPSLVNLIVEPGTHSWQDLVSQIDCGIIVDQILGGGADISGDFSINVDLGYYVHQGQIIGRVKDTMIAGNVYNVLKQISALGNDSVWNGSCCTPSLIVEGLSVISEQ